MRPLRTDEIRNPSALLYNKRQRTMINRQVLPILHSSNRQRAMNDLTEVREFPLYALKLYRRYHRMLEVIEPYCAEYAGLKPQHLFMIAVLEVGHEYTISELKRKNMWFGGNLTYIVGRFISLGWLVIFEGQDKRTNMMCLTPAGAELASKVRKALHSRAHRFSSFEDENLI